MASERRVARGLTLVAIGALVALPVGALALAALELGPGALIDGLAESLPAVGGSAITGLGAALLAVVLGSALALLTERSNIPGRRALRLAMITALLVPGYVAAVGWLRAYGPAGLLDRATGLALPGLEGPLGILLVLAAESAPLVYLIVGAGLAMRAAPDLERAARASGASRWTTFRTVSLPLLAPVIAAAAAIAFVLSVTAFGAPAVLGIPGGFSTMTVRIYRQLAFSSDPAAFASAVALALSLAVAASLAILGAARLVGRRPAERTAGPLGGIARPPTGAGRAAQSTVAELLAALVAWVVVGLAIIVPLAALLLTALARAPGLAPVPASWTLDNFAAVLDRHTLAALGNSLALSALAAEGVLVLAGLALAASRGRASKVATSGIGLTFAIPGSTLAVAILLAYGPLLRDTLAIILLAYVAKFWLLGYRPLAAGLEQLPADLARAARVAGASAATTLRTITLPLLLPALAAAGLLVFLFGLHEITISSLLYGPGTATLAVVVLNLQQLGDPNLTAALAVLISLLVALPALALALIARRRGGLAGWL